MEIKLIVSNPYCPSSELLVRRVREVVDLHFEGENIDFFIESCDNIVAFDEWTAAQKFYFDRSTLDKIYQRRADEREGVYRKSDLWCREVEEIREELSSIVQNNGGFLTPLLFIDGNLVSEGSCPEPCKIESWIRNGGNNVSRS